MLEDKQGEAINYREIFFYLDSKILFGYHLLLKTENTIAK